MYIVDEFLAEAEGRRAYEKLPEKIHRALLEFYGQLRAWLKDNGFSHLANAMGIKLDSFTPSDLGPVLHKIRNQESDISSSAIRFHRAWHGSYSLLDSNTPLPKDEWLSVGYITQIIDDLTQQFSHEAPILIRDTVGDVDASLVPHSGIISGMFYGGRIYVFRDGMDNTASVHSTLWHELFHYGLRRFLTK
jgi:hypothetical protein